MFVFGHLGPSLAGARFIRHKLDYRWVVFYALLPDLIDKPLATWVYTSIGSGRIFGHNLFLYIILLLLCLGLKSKFLPHWTYFLFTLGHLALDLLANSLGWTNFFWPFWPLMPTYRYDDKSLIELILTIFTAIKTTPIVLLFELAGLLYCLRFIPPFLRKVKTIFTSD